MDSDAFGRYKEGEPGHAERHYEGLPGAGTPAGAQSKWEPSGAGKKLLRLTELYQGLLLKPEHTDLTQVRTSSELRQKTAASFPVSQYTYIYI